MYAADLRTGEPKHWTPGLAEAATVRLEPGSQEYDTVEQFFAQRLYASVRTRILKIERVQNLDIYRGYQTHLQTLKLRERRRREKGRAALTQAQIERKWLFHGTNIETARKVAARGFNRSYAGANATLFGKGTYFARDSGYSYQDRYAAPDDCGHKYIFLCRVAVGAFCKVTRGYDELEPPMRDGQVLYDSTGDASDNPEVVVAYKDAQVYPEYLVVCEKVK